MPRATLQLSVRWAAPGNGTTYYDRFLAVGIGSASFNRRQALVRPTNYDFRAVPDVIETPRRNYTNPILRVSALTGRVKFQNRPNP